MQPVRDVVIRRWHRIGDAGLIGSPGAGQDREGTAVARRRIATRCLARVRSPPVEGLVDAVPDGGEGQEAPAEDPVRDLDASPDVETDDTAVRQLDLVPGERLAGRKDPADRYPGRTVAVRVAPAVGEMRDHEEAGRARGPEVDHQLAVDEDPAPAGGPPPEGEWQAAEDRRSVGQARDGRSIERMEAVGDIGVGRVPGRRQVDRMGRGCGGMLALGRHVPGTLSRRH